MPHLLFQGLTTNPEPILYTFFGRLLIHENDLEILDPVFFLVILDQHLVVLVLALPLSEPAAENVDLLGRCCGVRVGGSGGGEGL